MDETYQIIEKMLADQYPEIVKWGGKCFTYRHPRKSHFEFFVFFMITEYFGIEGKIPLIKLFRHVFSSSLKDAKETVEEMEEKSYLKFNVDDELEISVRGKQYIKDYEYLMPKDYAKTLSSVAIGLLEGKKDEYRDHTDYYNALKTLKIGWGNNE